MKESLTEYPAVLTVSEVASILHVTPPTVRKHIKENDLPHVKIGKLVRIPKNSLLAFLQGDLIKDEKEISA